MLSPPVTTSGGEKADLVSFVTPTRKREQIQIAVAHLQAEVRGVVRPFQVGNKWRFDLPQKMKRGEQTC